MAGIVSAANLGGVADPRIGMEPDAIGSKQFDGSVGKPSGRRGSYHDPNISFDEYHYWAKLTRDWEKSAANNPPKSIGMATTFIGRTMGKKEREADFARRTSMAPIEKLPDIDEKAGDSSSPPAENAWSVITDEEWHTASRAARTATWGAVFYLITTDILGPFSVPYAISQLGYGPGFALYVVFGAMAGYSGWLLWQQFMGLDSDKYPVKTYGDLAFRIYGSWARYLSNVLQSSQFFLNVALLIVSNGQSLAQLAVGPNGTGFLCFVAAQAIFTAAGFILGQIRTLQRLSYLANVAVWMNVFIIFMVMGVASNSPPNYTANAASGNTDTSPVTTSANTPGGKDIVDQVNGLMQAVFSYGGATLFCELMAEMRRPWDFWKGLICADVFIFACYIIFGMVVYSEQGQYAYNPAYQGIDPYAWQTVGNVFGLITGLIAALLYGNIGIKVLYANVGRELLRFPLLETKKGKIIWVFLIPIYWAAAFVLAAAIPQVSNLSAFVGAACILQFTYTFPPIMMIGYNIQKDAMIDGDTFDPNTGVATHADAGIKRYVRGYMKQFSKNTFDLVYFLGSLTTAGLGIYASVIGMHKAFTSSPITPFTCANPAG